MAGRRTNPHPLLVLVKLVGTLIVTGVLAAGVLLPFVGGIGLAAKHEADQFLGKTCNLQETPPPQKSQVYARDGKTLIATIFKQDRQPIALDQVPKTLQQALVATEDRRFYSHHGVDMRGLIRSAINTSSGDTQGGSTLTMQYVKQIRYYQAGDDTKKQADAIAQNIDRKIEDAKCALYIEGTLHESKDTILQNYLNIAFFGENSYGIETASQTYFDKTAGQLTLPESAMLVGLLRAPTQYDPFLNPDAARLRRDQVLQNLVTVGDLTQVDADKYKATPVSLATSSPPLVREGCANAATEIRNVGFFCDYAVNSLLKSKAVTEAQLQTGGLKIVTTLNPNLQNATQKNIAKALAADADMSAVMPILDPHTGEILAMATSKRYGTRGSATTLPIFTSYTAQGASTYKLFPLLTALSTGVPSDWQLQTPSSTEPYPWAACPASNGPVGNADANEAFLPNETLTSATVKSSNTFFTGIADQLFGCQLQPIIDMAARLGMKSLSQPSGDEPGVTVAQQILKYRSAKRLVLGDIATSPLELTSAYAAVANAGKYNAPAAILSVSDSRGRAITVPRSAGVQVINEQVALEAVEILTGDTKEPGTSAVPFEQWYTQHASLIAGKTGTAPGRDAKTGADDKNGALWFVGMTPDLVATTALINLDNPSYAASGLPHLRDEKNTAFGQYAAGVWLKALEPALANKSWAWQSPLAVSGQLVPPEIIGMSPEDANTLLRRNGFKMQLLGSGTVECASRLTPGEIAFFGPTIAPKGSTVTVCPSLGVQQPIYVKPKPPPPPKSTPRSASGSSSTSGSASGSGSTPPPAGGGSSGSGTGTGTGGNGNGNGRPGGPRPTH